MRAADIINIKLMKTGGISNAIHIADIAAMYRVECMIGCMIETSISVAAAVHVAVAKADVITKVDLDGPSLCKFNPVDGGVMFNESEITVTDAPGLGIREIRGLEPIAGLRHVDVLAPQNPRRARPDVGDRAAHRGLHPRERAPAARLLLAAARELRWASASRAW